MEMLELLRKGITIKSYSKQGLTTLFLICAFPTHLWTFILSFKDFSLLIDRLVGVWGAIGVLSYGLVFAFLESVLVFFVTALLGFLVSSRWQESERIALLSFLVTVVMTTEILSQAMFIWNLHLPGRVARFVAQFHFPFAAFYAFALIAVLAITLIPVFLILRRGKFHGFVRAVIERLTLLSEFYLFFDTLALIIVIVRNI